MAFAKLFTGLSAVEEDVVKSPGEPAFAHRCGSENGEKGNARKRKTPGEQTGPYKRKQCSQAQTTRTCNATLDDSKATHYPMHNTDSEHASVGFTKGVTHGHKNMGHKGQKSKTKNSRNVNKPQEQKKKSEWKNNPHQQKAGGRAAYRGARPTSGVRRNKYDKQDFEVKRTRNMTQEFKDQNALLVDGRILCRHFVWGRCIKGDDCQLEHIKGYNDLVKEVCKFYVQGLCTKGESCPYMHKSFPCKFFHRKGKCFQGADCRFSHEPLNDVTNQLLDEALRRDNDLYELAKKAEEESSGPPANTDESETIDANRTPDVLIRPLMPNFYKSADTNAEKESLLRQTEEPAGNTEQAVPPHSPPSTNLQHTEPVCYSVEAILGPQLSKPFPSFFTTPRSQDSAPLSSADQVPYSVDAVLKSCKSVENSTFGHTPAPPTAPTVTYTPKTDFEEITDPPRSSETPNEKVLDSVNMRDKMVKSLSLASGDHRKQRGNMPASLKPAEIASHEVQMELLHPPVTMAEKSVSSKSKGDMKGGTQLPMDVTYSVNCKGPPFGPTKHKSLFARPPSLTSTSKHPTQLKPHLSVLTSDSKASFKPFCPSAGFTRFKGRAAVPSEPVTCSIKSSHSANSVSRHFAAKQPPEIHLHSKKTQSGLKPGTQQHYSTETTAECSEAMARGGLAVGCRNTLKRPFQSLFASPISDTLQPIDDSVASLSCPQGLIQSSCPAARSADRRSIHLKTAVEPDKASARPFISLFAAPLSAAALPRVQSQPDYSRTSSCSQQSTRSVDNTSQLSEGRASKSPLPRQVRANVKEIFHAPLSPNFSPNPKTGNEDNSTERINQPTKQRVNPVCSLVSGSLGERSDSPTPRCNSPSKTHAPQQLPHISPLKESAVEAAANSVLKTLFLCLSPYRQDGEGSEKKDRSSAGCVFVKQQWKSKRKKKLQTQDSHKQSTEETVARSAERQPSLQTPQISSEATAGSTLSSPGLTEPQVRNSGTHNLPFKPLLQHHSRPRLKHTPEEGKWVKGSAAATPLKDLFKTLDTTVFHSGH